MNPIHILRMLGCGKNTLFTSLKRAKLKRRTHIGIKVKFVK